MIQHIDMFIWMECDIGGPLAPRLQGNFMKIKSTLLALLAGLSIGAISASAAHSQERAAASPRAFYISEFEVTDSEGIKPYSARVASTFEPYGGRYIVRGGKISTLEGEGPQNRVVIIEFDSMEKAQAWYNSPAYVELKPIRLRSAKSNVFLVEGTPN
jgi:uncharacterized protein (DUF1330 family)